MVTLPTLGLYAFSSLSNEGAVDDDILVRWCCDEAEDKKGSVGVECRRCLSHCWAFDRGIRSNNFMSNEKKKVKKKARSLKKLTDLIQYKYQFFPFRLSSPNFLFH